jgi:tripartite-type tricarboxylate transporter receptor subunit TctC
MMKRRLLLQLLGTALPASGVFAQSASGRPLRIIVPLSAATPTDSITRLIAPGLSALLGQPVIVENKPGANSVIAVQELMRAAPDGNTLMMSSVSGLAMNMALVKNLPYDSKRDFTPIAGAYSANHAWLVKTNFPARTIPELIAHLKKNPGKVSVGSSSALQQLQLAAFDKMAGTQMLVVPYKSTATSFTDFLGGTLDLCLYDMATALAQVKGGQVRALGVATLKRNPLAPDWPAISETLPGFDFASWSALVGPAGMPPEVANRISAAVAQVLKQKEMVDKFTEGGTVPMIMNPGELKAFISSEVDKSIRVAREANIQPE